LGLPGPASATVISSVSGGVLTATGDSDPDTIVVSCAGGNVKVTGADPSSGPASCSSIVSIAASGGGGDDTIDLAGDATQFASLTTSTLSGDSGRDGLFAEQLPAPSHIDGGPDDDSIAGGPGDDTLIGGSGRDYLRAVPGADLTLTDTTMAGVGSDSLSGIESVEVDASSAANNIDASGFSGAVTVYGGDGNDVIRGGSGNDQLIGQGGDDSIHAGGGADSLSGDAMSTSGPGNDTLDGGTGTDVMFEGADVNLTVTDSSMTGLGTDALASIETVDLSGGPTSNTIDGSAFSGQVDVHGGGGNDGLIAGSGGGVLYGEEGNDLIIGGGGNDFLDGGAGTNSLAGGAGNDELTTYGINDSLNGGPGTDKLVEPRTFGSSFTLTDLSVAFFGTTSTLSSIEEAQINGEGGPDKLDASGFSGNVALTGGDGDDVLKGGSGADSIDGGSGDDLVQGGAGNDALTGGPGTDKLFESADANFVLTDTTLAGLGSDTLSGFEHAQLEGGPGPNTLDASSFSGPVTLAGAAGSDLLTGGLANDTLLGGEGDDTLAGGPGIDMLVGGPGVDRFECDASDVVTGDSQDSYAQPCRPATTPTATSTTPATSGAQVSGNTGQGTTGLAAGVLGFRLISLAEARHTLALRLVVANTVGTPFAVVVRASERPPGARAKQAVASVRYPAVKASVPAGGHITIVLKPSKTLVAQLKGALARHHRVVRQITITVRNVLTGGSLTLKRKVVATTIRAGAVVP
jgi:Ca2+-binding RTX toxin-like protein